METITQTLLMVAVVATAALFTLTACGGTGLSSKSDSNTKVTKKAPKDLKVGVSLSTLSNPFFVSVRNGIQDLAKRIKPMFKFPMLKMIPLSKTVTLKI